MNGERNGARAGMDEGRNGEIDEGRLAQFLDPGERVETAIPATPYPPRGTEEVEPAEWPPPHGSVRVLLVATDRRWLVVESDPDVSDGALHLRGVFDRAIEVGSTWVTQVDAFDQPYAIDPAHEDRACKANRALALRS
ncbi:MAG: hypothetical protein ACXVW4_09790 [Nocardioides sp.]